MRRRTCWYSGQVQGVGFRWTVRNLAIPFDVTGFVRNLRDGRVEVLMEGTIAEMTMLQEEIQRRLGAYISDSQVKEEAATGEFERFEIRL